MKEFLKKLASTNGDVSSKRIITITTAIVLFISLLLNQIFGLQVNLRFIEALEWIVMAGLTTTVAERFAKKENLTSEKDDKSVI